MRDLEHLRRRYADHVPGLLGARHSYAVLCPLVERPDGLHLLYEVRAAALHRQPGEVCFPGGRIEGDETPEACAIRETEEELGIPTASITVLGRLDFVAHRANFIMYPVLARVETAAAERMALNPAEVDHTFLVPLEHIVHNPPLEYSYALEPRPPADFPYQLIGIPRGYRWQQGRETVPVYLWQGHAIWGLTGRITRHLAGLLGGRRRKRKRRPVRRGRKA